MDNKHIEIIQKLISIQNKLKNSMIRKAIIENIKDESFDYNNLILAIDNYIKNKEELVVLNDSNYLEQFNNSLQTFILRTTNESNIYSYRVELLDAINMIIDYQNILLNIKNNEEFSIQISEKEFSKRYDNLLTLLNDNPENSNLTLNTKENVPSKLYRNSNNSISVFAGVGSKISLTKDRLINTVYRKQEYSYHTSYADIVIEKILDNTIFDNLERQNDFDGLPNAVLESKIKDLEKKNFEILGQFSELKNLFEKRETEFSQVNEVLEKSKTLESEFDNAKEAVLKNIELKQATTYWEKQAEKYDKKYKFYFRTNIVIGVSLIIITFILINFTGLFTPNITDTADKKISDTITQVVHSASFFNYIIFIMFTTIMVWMMKILVKIMLSNYHLAVDANERVIMLNTYLVLLEDGKGFEENDRKVILDNIFRQTNHGIITDETSVTVADIVSSFKNK